MDRDLLYNLLSKSEGSRPYLWLLNTVLPWIVPFNAPHGLRVTEVASERVRILVPYRRKNLNHIKSLHACVLATACEFSSGLFLFKHVGTRQFRLIMQEIQMSYFYQGKLPGIATCEVSASRLKEAIIDPLNQGEIVTEQITAHVEDTEGNKLCTGRITWQLKDWRQVKTRV